MAIQVEASTSYPVETSGWDLDEKFFVEKTELNWNDDVKLVNLQHSVRVGAVVFVRLLASHAQVTACPVAYEVVRINHKPMLRYYEVTLSRLHPRVPDSKPAKIGFN